MTNLKRSKSERDSEVSAAPSEEEAYPWGLRLHLEEPEIEKLGIDSVEVGATLDVTGKVKVTSFSNHEDGKENRRSIELQVTDLVLPTSDSREDRMYGKSK
ncbi:MAG: capsid staple protein [Candidatus Thiodiazotropha endolucinida]